jgi:hypothetical protein
MRRLLLIVLFAATARAHDFWIEPSTFRPEPGKSFTAALRVGEHFAGDPVPRRNARIESFVVRGASGEQAIDGFENQDPAGFVRLEEAGTAVIGYRGKPTPHELPSAKFAQFLREEGITGITPSARKQRERFYRFAKAVVQVGDGAGTPASFGWRFELVPTPAGYRLLFEQKPLANVQVVAMSSEGKRLTARTDPSGDVSFALGKGVWLLKATHVLPAAKDSGYDWDSLWASLTFQR